MKFARWFELRWRLDGERKTTALMRLHVRSGLAPMTIRRALKGKPVRTRTARTLSDATGGEVTASAIAFPDEAEAA